MSKIISSINVTPDGFVDAQYINADADFFEFTHGLLAETQTVVFDRSTFELFQQVWPATLEKDGTPEWQVRMAQALNDIPKQVYLSGLNSTTWNNSTIVKAIDVETINHFKRTDQKGLLTFGSPGLVAALTEKQLVYDYYFCIQPVIGGGGLRFLFSTSGSSKLDRLCTEESCGERGITSTAKRGYGDPLKGGLQSNECSFAGRNTEFPTSESGDD